MNYLAVIVVILLVVAVFVIIRLLSKVEKLEDAVEKLDEQNVLLSDFIVEINNRLSEDYTKLKEIDIRGAFEADDEVGYVFKTLLNTVRDSYSFIKNTVRLDVEDADGETEKREEEEFES